MLMMTTTMMMKLLIVTTMPAITMKVGVQTTGDKSSPIGLCCYGPAGYLSLRSLLYSGVLV